MVGQQSSNPQLRQRHTEQLRRLPGLKFSRTLDAAGVPGHEKEEVLAAFAAHKGEVTKGSLAAAR